MTTLLGEFKAITKALSDAGIEYAICGGWAMAVHGFARATVDIDLLILSEDLSRAWETAKSLKYDVEGLPLSFSKGAVEIRRLSKVDKEAKRLFTIDFLLVTDALRGVWEERELIDWEEGRSSVVSKNGLIYLKRMAGRDQDLLDIKRLEETVDES
jgi:hypothetical protein